MSETPMPDQINNTNITNANVTVSSGASRLSPPYLFVALAGVSAWVHGICTNIFSSYPASDVSFNLVRQEFTSSQSELVGQGECGTGNSRYSGYQSHSQGNSYTESSGELPGVRIPGWKGMPSRPSTNGDYSAGMNLDGNLLLARLAIGLWQNKTVDVESNSDDSKLMAKEEFNIRRQLLEERWRKLDKYIAARVMNLDETDDHICGVLCELRMDLKNELKHNPDKTIRENIFDLFEKDTNLLEELIPIDDGVFREDYLMEIEKYRCALSEFVKNLPKKPYPQKTSLVIARALADFDRCQRVSLTHWEADQLLTSYQHLIGWVQNRHQARWGCFDSTIEDFKHLSGLFEKQFLCDYGSGHSNRNMFLSSEVPLMESYSSAHGLNNSSFNAAAVCANSELLGKL